MFPASRLRQLEPVLSEFEFRVTPYYSSLINWSDPDDPLGKIVLPHTDELVSGLDFDPSEEAANTRVLGLQHKYGPTALLLVTDVCASYCRFCFRKRFTLSTHPRTLPTDVLSTDSENGNRRAREVTLDVRAAAAYITEHPEIREVLLSGGDPLMLSPSRLHQVLTALRRIPHVRAIRIGSKVPAFDPERVTPELVEVLAAAGGPDQRVYVATHFSHPRELTSTARTAIGRLLSTGTVLYNQTPILRGINDNVDDLVTLLQELSHAGVAPYYLFQCRPVNGIERFTLSIQRGIELVGEARRRLSGLAKRFRYVASHATGKIEIVGIVDNKIIFRYHQARDPQDDGRVFTWPARKPVLWPDEAVRRLPRR